MKVKTSSQLRLPSQAVWWTALQYGGSLNFTVRLWGEKKYIIMKHFFFFGKKEANEIQKLASR